MSDITIKNLVCGYGDKRIFDGFDATFEENKINVILGSSGVGKSTLLNAIAGLKSYEGEIDGAYGNVSYIFQKDRLIPTISVYKNLDLILRAVYKDKNNRRKMIEEMAKLVEIEPLLKKLPSEISGGESQRVAMARAFLYPSKVLLLDEPFKGLDTALKSRLIAKLVQLNSMEERTIVFVTHAIDECLLCADNWYVLAKAPVEIVAQGSIDFVKSGRKLTDSRLEKTREELLVALTKEY